MTDPIGLYIHVPFCRRKCAYCDFYSAVVTEEKINEYLAAVTVELKRWGGELRCLVDTVYIGGGTPSVLGARIETVLDAVKSAFSLLPEAEITVEMNPSDESQAFLSAAKRGGVNRLSIGLQSGRNGELRLLGRTHTAETARKTVEAARAAGFCNISLDLMAGLPESSTETLGESIDFALSLAPEHLSAYLLKIEPNTRLFAERDRLILPDDDAQAEQYLYMCDRLRENGYRHYEISNFAKPGFESRHNMKYWTGKPYLGVGPAAHSMIGGKRFYYPRDLKGFLTAPQTVADGSGGDEEERILLGLRLSEGVDLSGYAAVGTYLERLCSAGYGRFSGKRFSLADRGMLVSNEIITGILENLS